MSNEQTLVATESPALAADIYAKFPSEFIAKLKAMIDDLPQAPHLSQERIDRWLSAILSFEPERVEWHIKRLSGLGGSEIGHVVAPFADEYDPFSQPKDIFLDKLMYTTPSAPNGHMRRGIFMEDMIRDEFRKLFQFTSAEADIAKFATFRDPKHPWLVGNPDDYGMIGNRLFMVDYKCPMPSFKEKYDTFGVSFGYICQLHHYTQIARRLGLEVDGLALCSWDMENWTVDVRSVELNEELMDMIMEAGDWLWNECILQGKLPQTKYPPRLTITDADKDAVKLQALIEQSAKYSVIANRAYALDKEVKLEISNVLATRRLASAKLVYGITDVSAKEELDMELAEAHLARLGKKLTDFEVPNDDYSSELILVAAQKAGLDLSACRGKALDEVAMSDFLTANHIDREQFTKEKFSIGLSRSAIPEIKDALTGLKKEADSVISQFQITNKGKFMPSRNASASSASPAPKKPKM